MSADALLDRVRPDGSLAGRFDCNWQGTVPWSCLTGDAQLAGVWLTLAKLTGVSRYREAARQVLQFFKADSELHLHPTVGFAEASRGYTPSTVNMAASRSSTGRPSSTSTPSFWTKTIDEFDAKTAGLRLED